MALKRYLGPHDEVTVKVAGHDLGYVKKGESIFVPEELVGLTVWQEKNWDDGAPVVPVPKPRKNEERGTD